MPIITRTEQDLVSDGLSRLLNDTPITATQRGSTARTLLEISANQIAVLHRKIDQTRMDMFLSTAQGDALDGIGELLGVKRGVALRAFDDTDNVKFFIDPGLGEGAAAAVRGRITDATIDANPESLSPTGFTIRPGITLTANSISYTTTTGAAFSGSDTEKFVGVIANGVGPGYNVQTGQLNKNNIQDMHPEFGTLAPFILVENTMPITTGRFQESDESYRFRLQRALPTLQGGNQSAIVAAALSVPGVRDALYIPYTRGLSSFTVVIRSTTPIVSDGLKNAAQAAVDLATSAGIRGSVIAPRYRAIQLKVALEYRPRADRLNIRQAARVAGVEYINSLTLGETFILNELIQRILDTDQNILDLHFDVFGYGWYNPKSQRMDFQASSPSNLYLPSKWAAWYTSDRLFTVCDA